MESTQKTLPSSFPPALARALESVEAEVWSDMYRAATPEDVAACAIGVSTLDGTAVLTVGDLDILAFNRAIGLGIGTPAAPGTADRLVRHYAARNVPRFFVPMSPAATPAGLFDDLQRAGFYHYNNWVKLFRGVDAPPAVDTTLRVERIGPEHAATFADLIAPAFDWPDVVRPWLGRLVGRPGWHHYLALDGDVPIATGALYVTGTYGYLGPAATHPDHRRRGAQGALIARRIRTARTLGCETLITETAEDRPERSAPSYRNMLRMGFEVAYVRPNYIYESDPSPSDR